MSDAWFYGGIRSIGRFVCVLDESRRPKVCYRVVGSRRKLRQRIRFEYGDSIIIVPLHYPGREPRTEGVTTQFSVTIAA